MLVEDGPLYQVCWFFFVILKNFLETIDYVARCKLFQGPNEGYRVSKVSTNVTLVGIFGSKETPT